SRAWHVRRLGAERVSASRPPCAARARGDARERAPRAAGREAAARGRRPRSARGRIPRASARGAPLAGALVRGRFGARERRGARGSPALARVLALRDGRLHRARAPARVAAGARRLPGARARARHRPRAGRASAGRRRRRAPDGARAPRPRGRVARLGLRGPAAVHERGGGDRRGLRRAAVLRAHGRGRPPRGRSQARGGGADAGSGAVDGLSPRHAPAPSPGARRRRRARLGARARRVRRDHHVRRQLPREDADASAARVRVAREPTGGRDPLERRAARGVARRPGRAPPRLLRGAVSVEARLRVRRGELDLDVELAIARGELVALLGPNGAGKTTIVHALAGLVALDAGSLRIDGVTLDDPAAGVFVPPEERPVAVAFQDLLLFPHLSAVANVAFGLRARGVARAAADRAAREWLERFGIAALAERKPRELSGGEAQRVALARALALGPALLLLDEPFSALDAEARGRLRRDLRAHLARQPGMRLLVTHDPVEAIALADRLVVLESGRVTHSGTAADIAARPRSPYAAALAGVNLFRGRARDRR